MAILYSNFKNFKVELDKLQSDKSTHSIKQEIEFVLIIILTSRKMNENFTDLLNKNSGTVKEILIKDNWRVF